MRILVINPPLPNHQVLDANDRDQMANIKDLKRLGHEVKLLTRTSPYIALETCEKYYASEEIDANVIPWQKRPMLQYRLRDIAFLNGICWEYGKPDFVQALAKTLMVWKPDLVWGHMGSVWPAVALAKRQGIPTIIRSIEYEIFNPSNYLAHNRQALKRLPLLRLLRYWGVWLSEYRSLQSATTYLAITPSEKALYQKLRPKSNVQVLPLRLLPRFVSALPCKVSNRHPLRVFFMGTKYTAQHNLAALKLIVHEIIPRVRTLAPNAFEFHILGSRIPEQYRQQASTDLVFDGYVPDLDSHLQGMDIALYPSITGVGMQQKIFESLCRGIPTITFSRGLSGFRFEHGTNVLLAENTEGFVHELMALQDATARKSLGEAARQRCIQLFSQEQFDSCLFGILQNALHPTTQQYSQSFWSTEIPA